MARLGRTTWICYILILQLLNAQWCCDSFVQCHSISTSAQSFPSSRLGATSTAAAVLFPERFCRSLGSDMVDYNNSLQRLTSRRTLHLQRSPPELTQPPPGLEQHRNYPNDSLPAELQSAPPDTTVAPDVLDHLGEIPVRLRPVQMSPVRLRPVQTLWIPVRLGPVQRPPVRLRPVLTLWPA